MTSLENYQDPNVHHSKEWNIAILIHDLLFNDVKGILEGHSFENTKVLKPWKMLSNSQKSTLSNFLSSRSLFFCFTSISWQTEPMSIWLIIYSQKVNQIPRKMQFLINKTKAFPEFLLSLLWNTFFAILRSKMPFFALFGLNILPIDNHFKTTKQKHFFRKIREILPICKIRCRSSQRFHDDSEQWNRECK